MNTSLLIMLICCVGSFIATYFLQRRGGLRLDVPNLRSFHDCAVPRGGGVAFVLSAGAAALFLFGYSEQNSVLGVFAGLTIGCAVIGMVDDMRGLPAWSRLVCECVLAGLAWLAGLRWVSVDVFGFHLDLSLWQSLTVTIFWIVWVTNLYNFMDGINGMAAGCGVVFSGVYSAVAAKYGFSGLAAWFGCVAASLLGFLPFNFPRAVIFMGDVGSLFLGFLFAVAPLFIHTQLKDFSIGIAIVIIAPFFWDTSLTLLGRMISRKNVLRAHTEHFFQQLTKTCGSQLPAIVLYLSLSVICGMLVFHSISSGSFLVSKMEILVFLLVAVLFILIAVFYHRRNSKLV